MLDPGLSIVGQMRGLETEILISAFTTFSPVAVAPTAVILPEFTQTLPGITTLHLNLSKFVKTHLTLRRFTWICLNLHEFT